MTGGSLGISLSSLQLLNQQMSVISNNISNASTPGYTKKSLPQQTQRNDLGPQGVKAGIIERNMDIILRRDLFTQTGAAANAEVQQRYQNQIQSFHRPPEENKSITAELGRLKDSFSELANTPESTALVDVVYDQAEYFAKQLNDFSSLLTQLRNDAQNEMQLLVEGVNTTLQDFQDLNLKIKVEHTLGRTTADLEDQRDQLMSQLSQDLGIDYYEDESKVMHVLTPYGTPLVDITVNELLFNPEPIGPQTFYPNSVSGVFVGEFTGPDLAEESRIGGRLGALLELRDETLTTYHAQLDELAHKTAERFDAAGLRLFTNPRNEIPLNNPTDYAGFAADIQINPNVIADKSLIQRGTATNSTVQQGSPEIARRVVEFVFGKESGLQAEGNVDLSGVGTVFATAGIEARARYIGDTNVVSLGALESSTFIDPGVMDTFSIQDGAALPINITINPGDTAADLINTINLSFPGMASLGQSGEIILEGNEDITVATGTLNSPALAELGLQAGVIQAQNPSFSIAVGVENPVEIEIDPLDTGADLVNKINNTVDGVTASLDLVTGFLNIEPEFGGDFRLIDGLGNPLNALGMNTSQTTHQPFNSVNLGASGTISSGITTAVSLLEFSESMIAKQSIDAASVKQTYEFEESFRKTMETQLLNATGVNLDEEMALLIQIQTAYTASTKTIDTVNRMFDDLLAAIL